jgi:nucleoside-diphosphate-sugar epimerase
MNVSKLHQLGWRHRIDLETGIRSVYAGLGQQSWY